MPKRVLLWMLFLICAICCSNQVQVSAAARLKPRAMSTAMNTEQRAYMSRMYALFEIVSPKYAEKGLQKILDYLRFKRRIDDWIKANPDWWNKVKSNLDYCDSLLKVGELGTDIDAEDPDVRWQLFIEYGTPKDQLTLLGKCGQADTACTVWMLTWPSDSAAKRGLEISCRSTLGLSYPNEIMTSDEKDFPIAYPMWPFVNYAKFPCADGTTDLWFSVWVPGDQFTWLTLDKGQLSMQIDLYDSTKTVLIDSGKQIANLQMMRGILETVASQERRFIRAMGYIGFSTLRPGVYNAHLTVLGAQDNDGESWIEVVVPEEKRISDLLLLEQSMTTGDNVLPGIVRGRLANLYDNPECRLSPRAKFGLYLETTLPSGHGKYFEVWVTLLPIPEVSGWKSTSVKTGKPIVVADSLDRPFTNGEWHSSRNQKLLEEMAKSESDSKSSKTITLLRKKFDAPEDRVTIQVAPRLKSNLKSGQYLLTVTITDPERQNYFLSARRVIRIAPASEMEF